MKRPTRPQIAQAAAYCLRAATWGWAGGYAIVIFLMGLGELAQRSQTRAAIVVACIVLGFWSHIWMKENPAPRKLTPDDIARRERMLVNEREIEELLAQREQERGT